MAAATGKRRWAVDSVLALLAMAVELWLLAGDGDASTRAIALTVAAAAALAARRAAPLAVLGVALASAVAIVAGGEAPAGLCILVALYTVAEERPRRESLAALAPTAAIVTALSIVNTDPGDSRAGGRDRLAPADARASGASARTCGRGATSASSSPASPSTRSAPRSRASCTTSSPTP